MTVIDRLSDSLSPSRLYDRISRLWFCNYWIECSKCGFVGMGNQPLQNMHGRTPEDYVADHEKECDGSCQVVYFERAADRTD